MSKKYRVLINSCYGGFNLSKEAEEWLAERGVDGWYEWYHMDRHHPLLLEMIDSLGVEKASGHCCELEVVEIDTPLYKIIEYDGMEYVESPKSIDWIRIE